VRPIVKLGAPLVAAALALTACGGTTGGTSNAGGSSSSGGASGQKCDLKIGFFGALTGPDANLGTNIINGVKLAVDQYNAKHADCKVTAAPFDSQGDPAQAPALAKKAIDDKSVVGVVGPAFSGESNAADPLFNEAGLTAITPSATNVSLSTKGWKTFFRVLGSDGAQGASAAKYIKDVLGAKKVLVIDDATDYGKPLAGFIKQGLGSTAVGTVTVQKGDTNFSAAVTKIRSSGADVVSYSGYYTEAGLLTKQMRDAGIKATFVSGDGVKDVGYIKAGGAKATEGSILTCPCLPPDRAQGTFFQDYQKAYKTEPGTYSAEGFDAAKILLDGIAAGKTTRSDLLSFVKSYDAPGVSKQLKFDDKGEPASTAVWAYKVENGKIVPDREIK
jgi:branched-chain amino acid transport system substrate-binding protein